MPSLSTGWASIGNCVTSVTAAMTQAGIIRFMRLRNTSQERRLFCSLHPHSKLCKFFAISFDSAKAFDRKIHGSILQFAAEGDCSYLRGARRIRDALRVQYF